MTAPLIQQACGVVERLSDSVFVRAADALHLMCAKERGFAEIYSNDCHLLAAAPHFGLVGRNVALESIHHLIAFADFGELGAGEDVGDAAVGW